MNEADRALRVFISHSSRDELWARRIKQELLTLGFEVYVFEDDPQPGSPLIAKLDAALDWCDILVVFLSRRSQASNYVNQEIGYARAKEKRIIPIVEKYTRKNVLAMLNGLEYIPYDPAKPAEALEHMGDYLGAYQERWFATKSAEEAERARLQMLAMLGIAAVALGVLILLYASLEGGSGSVA